MRRALITASLLCGCVPGVGLHPDSRPSTAEVRHYRYADDSGLTVDTTSANLEHGLSQRTRVVGRFVADHIVLTPRVLYHVDGGGNQSTGHAHEGADVVTSASTIVAGGAGADKWRAEGTVGVQHDLDVGIPLSFRVLGRHSEEKDYVSSSGTGRVTTELFQRNTVISLWGGYGWDKVYPFEDPPGQRDLWPATHDRFVGGVTVAQNLSPRVVLTGTFSVTSQQGQLANPYRRALVRTSIFPEVVPGRRDRRTWSIGIAWHLGWDTALHLRQGVYDDSWGVLAWVPEVAVAKLVTPTLLVLAHYRAYRQQHAKFYKSTYAEVEPLLTGDMRLGDIADDTVGASVQWSLLGKIGDAQSLSLIVGYDRSWLRYRSLGRTVLADIANAAVVGAF